MRRLKVCLKITHTRGISVGSLSSCWCDREAGDWVFLYVGWGSRPRLL